MDFSRAKTIQINSNPIKVNLDRAGQLDVSVGVFLHGMYILITEIATIKVTVQENIFYILTKLVGRYSNKKMIRKTNHAINTITKSLNGEINQCWVQLLSHTQTFGKIRSRKD